MVALVLVLPAVGCGGGDDRFSPSPNVDATNHFHKGLEYIEFEVDTTLSPDEQNVNKFNRGFNAIQEFNEAIRIEPDYVHAYQNRGVSYYFLDQYETAIADFTKAIRLDPDNALAYASEDTLTPS